jgi:FkbM family methyltransferase
MKNNFSQKVLIIIFLLNVPLYYLIFNFFNVKYFSTTNTTLPLCTPNPITQIPNTIPPITPLTNTPVTPLTNTPITPQTNQSDKKTLDEHFDHYHFLQDYYCKKYYKYSAMPNMNSKTVEINVLGAKFTFPMHLYSSGDIVSSHIHNYGGWDNGKSAQMVERIEKYRLHHKLERNQVIFVDIGANIGWFSSIMAHIGFRVISFEPMVENEIIIRNNICNFKSINGKDNKNWIFVNKGLGENKQNCKTISLGNNYGNGNTICNDSYVIPNGYFVRSEIELDRIDNVFPLDIFDPPLNIGLVKIDVENHERYVLNGGPKFFNSPNVKSMVMEFLNAADLKDNFANNLYVYDKLVEWGWQLSIDNFEGKPVERFRPDYHPFIDALVWKRW